MKTLIFILIIALIGCNTPIRVVETITTDSVTGKSVKVITKYYDSTRQPSVNVTPYYNPWPWGWYDPFWRGTPWYSPRTIIVNPRPPVRRK